MTNLSVNPVTQSKDYTRDSIEEPLINKNKKTEIFKHFKDYCKVKRINTLNNITKIKDAYKLKKEKMKDLKEEYKKLKTEKKEMSKTIKLASLGLFSILNFGNFYLSYINKKYSFKLLRFFAFSSILCLSINAYGQARASKYIKNKTEQSFNKILADI